MNDVKKHGDGSKDPENHSHDDECVGPEGEVIVTLGGREQHVVDGDFRLVQIFLPAKIYFLSMNSADNGGEFSSCFRASDTLRVRRRRKAIRRSLT